MSTPLLEFTDICAGYNGSIVLDHLSFSLAQGEVVTLLGSNGAGKTTAMRVVTGLLQPTAGTIRFRGEDLLAIPAHRRVDAGICLSPEGRQVFPNMTVEENLFLGSTAKRGRAVRRDTLDHVYTLFPRLLERREQKAGLMSGGEQQMLAIGRALMGKPQLLLLDEPSLGLAPVIVNLVFDAIRDIARSGISILLVEQNVHAAFSVAERGYVLEHGKAVSSGTVGELLQSEHVRKAFLPKVRVRAASIVAPPEPAAADPGPLMEVHGLQKNFGGLRATNDLSFQVRNNQFLGVIGPNGAGKTTLLNLLTGYLAPTAGTITFAGKRIDGLKPYEICRLGIGRTFQIVQPFLEMTVADNVLVGALFARGYDMSIAQARELIARPLELVGLAKKAGMLAGELSLGEKKKLELARALATQPRLLFLDEVMAGSTRGEIEELIEVLRNIHADGTTILMIEHLVHVIVELAQHVMVLNFGEKLHEGKPDDVVSHPMVIETYLGKPMESKVCAS
jgi:ABC-type branched-subunit amino acid transport system ATPase component